MRRGVAGLGLSLPALLVARLARAGETCVAPAGRTAEQEALRRSFHYRARSPQGAEKRCDGCEYFVAGSAALAGCGDCRMLHGLVDAGGWCDAFSEKD